MARPDDATLTAIGRLLTDVFMFDPPVGAAHLRWQYLENPEGVAGIGMVAEDGYHLGNYALVPLSLERQAKRIVVGIGIDLAVAEKARGTGTFRRTVEDAYRDGSTEGLDAILGVANASSAPRMAKTLGWRVLPPLPTRILAPGGRSTSSTMWSMRRS